MLVARVQLMRNDGVIITLKYATSSRALEIAQARPNIKKYRFIYRDESGFVDKRRFSLVKR